MADIFPPDTGEYFTTNYDEFIRLCALREMGNKLRDGKLAHLDHADPAAINADGSPRFAWRPGPAFMWGEV